MSFDLFKSKSCVEASAVEVLSAANFEKIENVNIAGTSTVISDYKWSDDQFKARFIDKVLAEGIEAPTPAAGVLMRVTALNMIYTGQVPDEMTYQEVVFYTLLSWVEDNEYVFDEFLMGENPINLYPVTDPETATMQMVWAQHKNKKGKTTSYHGTNFKISHTEAEDWYKLMNAALTNDRHLEHESATRIIMLYMLKLLRLRQKEFDDIELHICDSMTKLATNLCGWTSKLPIPPPHQNLKTLKLALEGETPRVHSIFTILVTKMVQISNPKSIIRQIMLAGCMLTFEKTGLGPLKWLADCSKLYSQSPGVILNYCAFGLMKWEVRKVVSFLLTLKECRTWPYARLMDSGVLTELSTVNTGHLSLTLAYLGRAEDEWEDLSAAVSLKQAMANKIWCKNAAETIKSTIMDVEEGSAETELSLKVVKKMQIKRKEEEVERKAKLAKNRKELESEDDEDEELRAVSKQKKKKKAPEPEKTQEESEEEEEEEEEDSETKAI